MPETIASAPSNGHAPPAPMPEPLRELPSRSRGWEYAAQRVSMSVPGITVDVYLSNAGRVEIEVKRAGVVVHEYRR